MLATLAIKGLAADSADQSRRGDRVPEDHAAGPGSRGSGGPPRARRRRSVDTPGGISVSDVLAQHTGIRPVFDTQAPSPDVPKPPERRPRDPHPSNPPAARRAAPPAEHR